MMDDGQVAGYHEAVVIITSLCWCQVDTLLEIGTNVTIFSGQLDLICCTDGTLNWMKALK